MRQLSAATEDELQITILLFFTFTIELFTEIEIKQNNKKNMAYTHNTIRLPIFH